MAVKDGLGVVDKYENYLRTDRVPKPFVIQIVCTETIYSQFIETCVLMSSIEYSRNGCRMLVYFDKIIVKEYLTKSYDQPTSLLVASTASRVTSFSGTTFILLHYIPLHLQLSSPRGQDCPFFLISLLTV